MYTDRCKETLLQRHVAKAPSRNTLKPHTSAKKHKVSIHQFFMYMYPKKNKIIGDLKAIQNLRSMKAYLTSLVNRMIP